MMLAMDVISTKITEEKLFIPNRSYKKMVGKIKPNLVDKVNVLSGSMPLPKLISFAVLLYSNESEIPIPEKNNILNINPNKTIRNSKILVLLKISFLLSLLNIFPQFTIYLRTNIFH